jgi:hypothetical protein
LARFCTPAEVRRRCKSSDAAAPAGAAHPLRVIAGKQESVLHHSSSSPPPLRSSRSQSHNSIPFFPTVNCQTMMPAVRRLTVAGGLAELCLRRFDPRALAPARKVTESSRRQFQSCRCRTTTSRSKRGAAWRGSDGRLGSSESHRGRKLNALARRRSRLHAAANPASSTPPLPEELLAGSSPVRIHATFAMISPSL